MNPDPQTEAAAAFLETRRSESGETSIGPGRDRSARSAVNSRSEFRSDRGELDVWPLSFSSEVLLEPFMETLWRHLEVGRRDSRRFLPAGETLKTTSNRIFMINVDICSNEASSIFNEASTTSQLLVQICGPRKHGPEEKVPLWSIIRKVVVVHTEIDLVKEKQKY